ncbi:hypothetical protein C8R43DRAFT_950696 [Mycena crocata]|nr:hypothetical protein C8R43DRAFT_950696 [Mycena crocata]
MMGICFNGNGYPLPEFLERFVRRYARNGLDLCSQSSGALSARDTLEFAVLPKHAIHTYSQHRRTSGGEDDISLMETVFVTCDASAYGAFNGPIQKPQNRKQNSNITPILVTEIFKISGHLPSKILPQIPRCWAFRSAGAVDLVRKRTARPRNVGITVLRDINPRLPHSSPEYSPLRRRYNGFPSYYPVAFQFKFAAVAFGSSLNHDFSSWGCRRRVHRHANLIRSRRIQLKFEGRLQCRVLLNASRHTYHAFKTTLQAAQFKFKCKPELLHPSKFLKLSSTAVSFKVEPYWKLEGWLHAAFTSALTNGFNLGLQSTQWIDGLLKEGTIAVQSGSMFLRPSPLESSSSSINESLCIPCGAKLLSAPDWFKSSMTIDLQDNGTSIRIDLRVPQILALQSTVTLFRFNLFCGGQTISAQSMGCLLNMLPIHFNAFTFIWRLLIRFIQHIPYSAQHVHTPLNMSIKSPALQVLVLFQCTVVDPPSTSCPV